MYNVHFESHMFLRLDGATAEIFVEALQVWFQFMRGMHRNHIAVGNLSCPGNLRDFNDTGVWRVGAQRLGKGSRKYLPGAWSDIWRGRCGRKVCVEVGRVFKRAQPVTSGQDTILRRRETVTISIS